MKVARVTVMSLCLSAAGCGELPADGVGDEAALASASVTWQRRSGAKGIDIGVTGRNAWVVDPTVTVGGGFRILEWDGDSQAWFRMNGGGVRISASNGVPWVIADDHTIWYRPLGHTGSDQAWVRYPHLSCAQDIAAVNDACNTSANPSVNWAYAIGCHGVGGGNFEVWRLDTGGVTKFDSFGAVRIATGESKTCWPYAVTADGRVWVHNALAPRNGHWGALSGPGKANDIGGEDDSGGFGQSGKLWIIGQANARSGGYVIEYLDRNTNIWTRVNGGALMIAAGRLGPWVVSNGADVFEMVGFN